MPLSILKVTKRKENLMGMAAGQARLLSITSRISDNELRAQIINNNKMRLATESSQASEAYVQALNESELMFTNFDAENNASYKKLTFNTMTAFNPYNNQYALVNSAGNVLISETDAMNYKKSEGDLETFLKSYGLEYTTTYFENVKRDGENVQFTYYDDWGNAQIGLSGFDPETLKYAYMGNLAYPNDGSLKDSDIPFNGGKKIEAENVNGYTQVVNSDLNYRYEKAMDRYLETRDVYYSKIRAAMLEELDNLSNQKCTNLKPANYQALYTEAERLTQNDSNFRRNKFGADVRSLISSFGEYAYKDKNGALAPNVNKFIEDLLETVGALEDGHMLLEYDPSNAQLVKDKNTGEMIFNYSDDEQAATVKTSPVQITMTKESESITIDKTVKDNDTYIKTFEYTEDPTTHEITDFHIEINRVLSDDELKGLAKEQILDRIRDNITVIWDVENKKWQTNDATKEAFEDYDKARDALLAVMYGNEATTAKSKVPINQLDDLSELYNGIIDSEKEYPAFESDEPNNFYQIYMKTVLDSVLDTYGEPRFAWIDTSDPRPSYNVNGEAKAKWYTNLFNRIESGGYKVLLDGLASSSEWIQFAFESGIVSMEQVDSYNNWNSLIYSNCSDITSQTNDKMIAKAEAEYNAAMNKIENKDKRYDLELKNIDTEHNSLVTEYDSIKAAIDKNVERTFKLYS